MRKIALFVLFIFACGGEPQPAPECYIVTCQSSRPGWIGSYIPPTVCTEQLCADAQNGWCFDGTGQECAE